MISCTFLFKLYRTLRFWPWQSSCRMVTSNWTWLVFSTRLLQGAEASSSLHHVRVYIYKLVATAKATVHLNGLSDSTILSREGEYEYFTSPKQRLGLTVVPQCHKLLNSSISGTYIVIPPTRSSLIPFGLRCPTSWSIYHKHFVLTPPLLAPASRLRTIETSATPRSWRS